MSILLLLVTSVGSSALLFALRKPDTTALHYPGTAGYNMDVTATRSPTTSTPTAIPPPVYPPDTQLTEQAVPTGIPMPSYLQPTKDPSFGTQVTRISDQQAFTSNQIALRHASPKTEAWNADDSLIMLSFGYPAAILDGHTYKFLRWIHQPAQAVWSNLDPGKMLGVEEGTNILEWVGAYKDFDKHVIHAFSGYDTINFGAGMGNLSNDDRYVALFGLKGPAVDLLVYDIQQGTVVSRLSMGDVHVGAGSTGVNSAAMSQSGKYVIVEYPQRGTGSQKGMVLFDRNLHFLRQLTINGGTQHDECYDTQGNEVMIIGDAWSSALVSVRLRDGRTTVILAARFMNYDYHISCRNIRRPGWVYMSETAAPSELQRANYQRVFALKIDGSGTVENFAFEHHSINLIYEREPQAVPNQDGSKVIWASDWENSSGPVYDYVAGK